MHKGEAGALQWPVINFNEGTITINKSLDYHRKGKDKLFGEVKTDHSARVITIRKSVVDELCFHLARQNQNKKQINDLYRHVLNLILCQKDGNPMSTSTLFNAFSHILNRADIMPLLFHSLHYTHAVLMLKAGRI